LALARSSPPSPSPRREYGRIWLTGRRRRVARRAFFLCLSQSRSGVRRGRNQAAKMNGANSLPFM
jgi:hypothetical protein